MKSRGLALLAVLALVSILASPRPASAQSSRQETPVERDARMKWWREARFGMFIHWGVYAVPAGEYKGQRFDHIGEWIMLDGRIPVAEYREYARQFNPVKYDPRFWAQLARDAGMKYMVITSKHHDGFALFPSDASKWDIADASPYGKDLIGPLAEAARSKGLKFGLYYSQAQDWTNPGGAKARDLGQGWDPAQHGDFDKYIGDVAVPQVREILTRYKPDVLWWDTPVSMNEARAKRFLPLLDLVPGIVTNDRLERPHYPGDFGTPEQKIPDTGLAKDWETCMTMNHTWGYKSYDHDWKSVEMLLRNLVDIASKGGNYLLNIGPKADGTIPQESIDRLRAIGKWMTTNGEAIYATTASPTARPTWGRITTKRQGDATTLYLHIFDWPQDGKLPVAVTNEVVSCRLLADPSRDLGVERGASGLVVQLGGEAPDEICSVAALTIQGAPEAAAGSAAPPPGKE